MKEQTNKWRTAFIATIIIIIVLAIVVAETYGNK